MDTKQYSEIVTCYHCYNISKMEIIDTAKDIIDEWGDPETGPMYDISNNYEILKCPSCREVTIRVYNWNEWNDGDDIVVEYDYLYPIRKEFPKGMPDNIIMAYSKAEKVKNIDVDVYILMLRKLLELVCLEKGATGYTLAAKITDLGKKGLIPPELVKVAEGLREFGNIGAHPEKGELSKDEIPIANALSNAILEYIYTAPYLVSLAESKLKKITTKKL